MHTTTTHDTYRDALHDTLLDRLGDFRAQALASAPVKRLIKRWDRTVALQPTEGPTYIMQTHAGTIAPIALQCDTHPTPEMTVTATRAVFTAIFSGELNPARAHLDGALHFSGSARDELVLDAIVMLIWGF